MLDTVVFGKWAGSHAATLAKEGPEKEKNGHGVRRHNSNDDHKGFDERMFIVKEPIHFRNEIQDSMTQNAGIVSKQCLMS